ncbi:hypothetical protein AS590_26065 [Prescottella equi]|nr:hypothetical protein AS590_26065 [Prescottella equi]
MNLKATWNDTSVILRIVAVAMVVTGAVLLVLGIVGDSRGWWGDHGFLLNAMTSAMGFMIGVPFALFGISAITDAREERAQLNRVRSLTDTSWKTFSDAALEYCSMDIINILYVEGGIVIARFVQIKRECEAFLEPVGAATNITQSADELRVSMREAADVIEASLGRINNGVEPSMSLQSSWASLTGKWQLLDTYVRAQRFESNLPWFSDVYDSWLQNRMSVSVNPFHGFNLVRDYTNGTPRDMPSTMGNFPMDLRHIADRSDGTMRQMIQHSALFGGARAEFNERAADATSILGNILTGVRGVNDQGWPSVEFDVNNQS